MAESELYVAVIINEITVDWPGHLPDFEESVVLVQAGDEDEAARVATVYAAEAETSYLNVYGETVRWTFRELAAIGVALTQDLERTAIGSGVEIFSRFFDDLEAYRAVRTGSPDAARWSPDLQDWTPDRS